MSRKRLKKGMLDPQNETLESVIPLFLTSREAQGVTEATIESYRSHFKTLSNYLDPTISFDDLCKEDIDEMVVAMRHKGLAHSTVASYCRVVRTFLNWCNAEGYTDVEGPRIKPIQRRTLTDTQSGLIIIWRNNDLLDSLPMAFVNQYKEAIICLMLLQMVFLTVRVHLFPFRTQKLSSPVPTILAW